jgi:hypothetical protein
MWEFLLWLQRAFALLFLAVIGGMIVLVIIAGYLNSKQKYERNKADDEENR